MNDYDVICSDKPKIVTKGGSMVSPPKDGKLKKILKKANTPITMQNPEIWKK